MGSCPQSVLFNNICHDFSTVAAPARPQNMSIFLCCVLALLSVSLLCVCLTVTVILRFLLPPVLLLLRCFMRRDNHAYQPDCRATRASWADRSAKQVARELCATCISNWAPLGVGACALEKNPEHFNVQKQNGLAHVSRWDFARICVSVPCTRHEANHLGALLLLNIKTNEILFVSSDRMLY